MTKTTNSPSGINSIIPFLFISFNQILYVFFFLQIRNIRNLVIKIACVVNLVLQLHVSS